MMPAFGLSLIARILEFCGKKIAANKRREKAAKIRAEKAKKKKIKAAIKKKRAQDKARLKKIRDKFAREAERKRINAENAAIFEAARKPVDVDPYGEG